VGSLVYLTVTRSDIAHAVHILSQFVSAPTFVHFGYLLHVLRYFRGISSNVCSMLVIVRFSFILTRIALGILTERIVVPSQDIAFFLAHLFLHGNL